VDLQGFSEPKKSFVKELAILCDGIVKLLTFTFAPPFPWHDLPLEYRRRNAWVERYYTGLKWNSGTIPYDRIEEILYSHLRDVKVIYVIGREKVNWLRTYLKPYHHMIENLENDYDDDDAIPSLRTLTNTCRYYKKFLCDADNMRALSQLVALKPPPEEPSADCSIRLIQKTGGSADCAARTYLYSERERQSVVTCKRSRHPPGRRGRRIITSARKAMGQNPEFGIPLKNSQPTDKLRRGPGCHRWRRGEGPAPQVRRWTGRRRLERSVVPHRPV